MSLFSTFVDALKKLTGKKPDIDLKTFGPLGSTTEGEGGKAFTPLRPAGQPDTGEEIDPGGLSVKSADPEEGGE